MATVLECSFQTHDMLLVVRICLHELVDDLNLFESSFEPISLGIRKAFVERVITYIDSWARIILIATSLP